ncbi:hypothetical protein AAFF_G00191140 [Aldrovandia affinis]|uniref:Spermatogenesis-associated protein 6 N-terminal domain-containing protein n=1 Tax=Aldrovandia affinis TaxID=143900 RepID=A0AAD7RJV9_9TELE|nr:hypothetical protein AAFF_G00191140 [Aldrovandia affinis]
MFQKATKVVVDLHLRAVTCPGVFLAAKDDIYLSVCILGHYKKSECLSSIFPLQFNERMRFEKVFKEVSDPAAVAELLESEKVKFELIQLIPPAGESIAYLEEEARTFLFPEPRLVPSSPGVGRVVLMTRAPNFPGIAPRVEFSTRTTIMECSAKSQNAITLSLPLRTVAKKVNNKKAGKRVCAEAQKPGGSVGRKKASRGVVWAPELREEEPRSRSQSPFAAGLRALKDSHGHSPRPGTLRPTSRKGGSKPELEMNGASSERRQKSPQHLPPSALMQEHLRRIADSRASINRSCSSGWAQEPVEYESWSPGPDDSAYSTANRSQRRPESQGRYRSPDSQHMWEEIHQRVRALLTTSTALNRLTYGATDSEIDDVMGRRCSQRACPT